MKFLGFGKSKNKKQSEQSDDIPQKVIYKNENSSGNLLSTLGKFIPVLLFGFVFLSIKGGSLDKEQIIIKSYNYNNKVIETKSIYDNEKDKSFLSIFKKKETRLIDKNRKFVAMIDFNSKNGSGEFERFSSKVDHIVSNKEKFKEVVIKIYSTGGSVIDYGSAMSQIKRLKNAGLKVTSVVDEVAASGGYLMAVVSDKIYANEFAFVGSIGVVASVPNVKKLLDNYGVSFEEYTAGESKRTITPFKEPTTEDVQKMNESLVKVHDQFKKIVSDNRKVDVSKVFNGDIFYGDEALSLGLVDDFKSSGDLLFEIIDSGDEVYHIIATGNKRVENNIMKVSFIDRTINTAFDKILLEINKDFFF